MEINVKEWLNREGEAVLEDIGIKKGDVVLDFGCGTGRYTILTAKVVSKKGKVYAMDKDIESMYKLMEIAKTKNLKNIIPLHAKPEEPKINLESESIDVVLLYDVIHLVGKNNTSTVDDRKKLYKDVYRITRKNALISVYPSHLTTHTDVTSKEEIKKEIEETGFSFEKEIYTELIHDDNKVKDYILNFRKK